MQITTNHIIHKQTFIYNVINQRLLKKLFGKTRMSRISWLVQQPCHKTFFSMISVSTFEKFGILKT